jgi:putative nucleotidyltransferase with HDIG domain
MNDFLIHSLSTAAIAKRLGLQLGVSEVNATDYFVAGLLHDFGKVVFAQFLPQEFSEALDLAENQSIALYHAEREIIGADHAELGAMLGEKWQLPVSLVTCIREHHATQVTADDTLLDAVRLANAISKRMNFGQSGCPVLDDMDDVVRRRFGTDLMDVVASMPNLAHDVDKVAVFAQV